MSIVQTWFVVAVATCWGLNAEIVAAADPETGCGARAPVSGVIDARRPEPRPDWRTAAGQGATATASVKPPDEATTLAARAVLLTDEGRLKEGIELGERALALIERRAARPIFQDGVVLNNAGLAYERAGDTTRAERLYVRALAVYRVTLPAEHKEVATTINNLASLCESLGLFDRADELYQQSLIIDTKVSGADSASVATTLSNQALLATYRGDYAAAEDLLKRVRAIDDARLESGHVDIARDRFNLAELYRIMGRYSEAEALLRESIAILESRVGPNHRLMGFVLASSGSLAFLQGDYERAATFLTRALALREDIYGESHVDVLVTLNQLALVYHEIGRLAEADVALGRALAIAEEVLGPIHPTTGTVLNNVSVLRTTTGDLELADAAAQRSLEIQEKSVGSTHPDVALALNNLALVASLRGEYARADQLLRRALAIDEQALGANHPVVARLLSNLALSAGAQDRLAEAVDYASRNGGIHEHNLQLILATGSEEQKRAYVNSLFVDTNAAISLHVDHAPRRPDALRLALTTILQRKGRALDAMSDHISRVRRRLAPADQSLFDRLSAVRAQLAGLVLGSSSAAAMALDLERVARLENEAEMLERQISTRSVEFQDEAEQVDFDRIRQSVPESAALVEIALYYPLDIRARAQRERFGPARYVAYVVKRGQEPTFVELGDAGRISRDVARLRTRLRDPNADDVRNAARDVYERVVEPIRSLLGTTRTLIISPDGDLNLVPFAALVDETERYLAQSYTITYVTSGRDLLRLNRKMPPRQSPLVIADPDFDRAGPNPVATQSTAIRSAELTKERWPRLQGTADEAVRLAGILQKADVLTRERATEEALKNASAPSILHIATHGFFLSDQDGVDPVIGRGGLPGPRLLAQARGAENPLLRSGLVLAGANRNTLDATGQDGLLTALEVAGLDLWGTRLVVLSACETGLGDVKNGEGVLGLRRALVLAGAESQLVTLWKVADTETRDFMVAYYQRLKAGETRGEALRQAQLQMLKSNQSNHPFYWASFIPIGDPTAIGGEFVQ